MFARGEGDGDWVELNANATELADDIAEELLLTVDCAVLDATLFVVVGYAGGKFGDAWLELMLLDCTLDVRGELETGLVDVLVVVAG